MKIDLKEIERLNKRAQQLNAERQKLIGKQEAAKSEFDKAILLYEQKYGKKLDFNNLQEEYIMVSEDLKNKYKVLEEQIRVIETGEYKNVVDENELPPFKLEVDTDNVNVELPSFMGGAKKEETSAFPPFNIGGSSTEKVDKSEEVFTPTGWGIPTGTVENESIYGKALKFDE